VSDVWQGPGWWQASDGRWYPPSAAPSTPEAVATVVPPDDQRAVAMPADAQVNDAQVNGAWPRRFDRPTPLPRNLAELLTLALLAAALVRFAAVAGAVIGWTRFPGQTHGQQVGTSLLVGGGFADGQGALLLAVALGLLWWQTYVWHRSAQAVQRLGRMRWGLRWLLVLAVATVAGSIVYVVGVVLYYAGSGSGRVVWEHFIASGGFAVAYAIIAGGVAFTTRRLLDDVPVVERAMRLQPGG